MTSGISVRLSLIRPTVKARREPIANPQGDCRQAGAVHRPVGLSHAWQCTFAGSPGPGLGCRRAAMMISAASGAFLVRTAQAAGSVLWLTELRFLGCGAPHRSFGAKYCWLKDW